MAENNNGNNNSNNNSYLMESRGYKTRGRSYKDRYLKDKICDECGGNSVYRDDWGSTISFKCLKRSCRHNWFERKPEEELAAERLEREELAKEAESEEAND